MEERNYADDDGNKNFRGDSAPEIASGQGEGDGEEDEIDIDNIGNRLGNFDAPPI